jgi:hypothetical protein
LHRYAPPVIIQSPEQVEADINKQDKENSLLKTGCQVLARKLPLKNQAEKPVELIYYYYNEKSVEQVPDTERNPAKKKPLHLGNGRINPIGIIIFHPAGVPGGPFDENRQDYKQYPAPAFHQPAKQTGNEFLQEGVILNVLGIRALN